MSKSTCSDAPRRGRPRARGVSILCTLLGLAAADAAGQAPAPAVDTATVEVAFTGDVMMTASVGRAIARWGVDFPWRDATPLLSAADLAVSNLETSVATGGEPVAKQYNFRSDPETLPGLVRAGIDVVTIANNHSLDYGPDALLETLDNVRAAGIGIVGGGADDDAAYAADVVVVDGIRVGFIGLSRVYPYDDWAATSRSPGVASGYDGLLPRVLRAVDAARPEVDALVVLVHWGSELADTARTIDRVFADSLLAHGVDALIGSHPHVLQGVEWRGDAVVAWSLGNFVFSSFRESTRQTGVLYVRFDRRGRVVGLRLEPMWIDSVRPNAPDAEQRAGVLRRLRRLSRPMGTLVLEDGTLTTGARLVAEGARRLLRFR